MKFNLDKALQSIADRGEEKVMYSYRSDREEIILRAFEFSDDQEKERILTYMKSIALGAQQERDFLPTRQWNKEIDDYERVIDSDSWDAGTTLVRLLGYRTGRSLSTKTLQTHRDFIALVVRDFCAPDEINWMWNGSCGLDRAYELASFGILEKVVDYNDATFQVAHKRWSWEREVQNASAAKIDLDVAIGKQLTARAALTSDALPEVDVTEPAGAC
jgi:hypothetical protein